MSKLLTLGAGGPVIASGPTLWTPNDEASLLAWFDTTADRYDGTTWTKRYGAGNNAVKEATGPTESTTTFNGSTRGLIFTGNSNTQLVWTPASMTEWITVAVVKFTTRAVDAVFVERSGYTNSRLITFSFGGVRVSYLGGDVDEYGAITTNPSMIVARHSKASRIARLNGTQISSGATATSGTENTTATLRFGAYEGSAKNWTMEATVWGIFANSGWSNALAEKIEGFIAHEGNLGITVADLPIGHPYKTNPPEV